MNVLIIFLAVYLICFFLKTLPIEGIAFLKKTNYENKKIKTIKDNKKIILPRRTYDYHNYDKFIINNQKPLLLLE